MIEAYSVHRATVIKVPEAIRRLPQTCTKTNDKSIVQKCFFSKALRKVNYFAAVNNSPD